MGRAGSRDRIGLRRRVTRSAHRPHAGPGRCFVRVDRCVCRGTRRDGRVRPADRGHRLRRGRDDVPGLDTHRVRRDRLLPEPLPHPLAAQSARQRERNLPYWDRMRREDHRQKSFQFSSAESGLVVATAPVTASGTSMWREGERSSSRTSKTSREGHSMRPGPRTRTVVVGPAPCAILSGSDDEDADGEAVERVRWRGPERATAGHRGAVAPEVIAPFRNSLK